MSTPSVQPCQRIILAVGMGATRACSNLVRAQLRRAMYDLVEQALVGSGITPDLRNGYVDRGDGLLVLIRPVDRVPKTWLLTKLVPRLEELLDAYNAGQHCPLRLKVAIHSGDVPYDEAGWFGEDIDIAVELLGAPALRGGLLRTSASLALVVSDQIHRSVIRHGYDGIDVRAFTLIQFEVGGTEYRGWVHEPSDAERGGDDDGPAPIDKVS
jgi:hypothetical protein